MQVRALRNGDIEIDGVPKALFAGQIYDLAESLVQEHDWLEIVTAEVEAKAIEASEVSDKAVRPRRNKAAE